MGAGIEYRADLLQSVEILPPGTMITSTRRWHDRHFRGAKRYYLTARYDEMDDAVELKGDWLTLRYHHWIVLRASAGRYEYSSDYLPVRPDTIIRRLFAELSDKWALDTLTSSSVTEIALHPAYQRIIGLGMQALPLIVERMRVSSEPWFWALRAIVGTDAAEGKTTVRDAIEAWTNWFSVGDGQIDYFRMPELSQSTVDDLN
jgi:hypothetical protein